MPRRRSKTKAAPTEEPVEAVDATEQTADSEELPVSKRLSKQNVETSSNGSGSSTPAERARRSTTVAQTAASQAGARVTRSVTRGPVAPNSSPSPQRRGKAASTESPALRVKTSPRGNKVSYQEESEGEEDVSTERKPDEEDEFQVEEDEMESDSEESRDAAKAKSTRTRQVSTSSRSKKNTRRGSRGKPTPAKAKKPAKDDDVDESMELDEDAEAPASKNKRRSKRQSTTVAAESPAVPATESSRSKRNKARTAEAAPEPSVPMRRSGRARKTLMEDVKGTELDDDEEEQEEEQEDDEEEKVEVRSRSSRKRKAEDEVDKESKKAKKTTEEQADDDEETKMEVDELNSDDVEVKEIEKVEETEKEVKEVKDEKKDVEEPEPMESKEEVEPVSEKVASPPAKKNELVAKKDDIPVKEESAPVQAKIAPSKVDEAPVGKNTTADVKESPSKEKVPIPKPVEATPKVDDAVKEKESPVKTNDPPPKEKAPPTVESPIKTAPKAPDGQEVPSKPQVSPTSAPPNPAPVAVADKKLEKPATTSPSLELRAAPKPISPLQNKISSPEKLTTTPAPKISSDSSSTNQTKQSTPTTSPEKKVSYPISGGSPKIVQKSAPTPITPPVMPLASSPAVVPGASVDNSIKNITLPKPNIDNRKILLSTSPVSHKQVSPQKPPLSTSQPLSSSTSPQQQQRSPSVHSTPPAVQPLSATPGATIRPAHQNSPSSHVSPPKLPSVNQHNSPVTVKDAPSTQPAADLQTKLNDQTMNGNKEKLSTITNDNGTAPPSSKVTPPACLPGRKLVSKAPCPVGSTKLFTVSYNLAGDIASNRHEKILLELKALNADLLFLQDVQQEYFKTKLQNSLDLLGYKGQLGQYGIATLYRTSAINCTYQKDVTIADIISKDFQLSGLDSESQAAVNNYLQSQDLGKVQYSQMKLGSKTLNVANIHLKKCEMSTHALQVSCVVKELLNQVDPESNSSQLLCGTFNMEEGYPGYQLIKDGYLSNEMIETLQKQTHVQVPNKENSSLVNLLWKSFQHSSSHLKSSYATVLGHELQKPSAAEGTSNASLDSIWFSSDTLCTSAVLDVDKSSTNNDSIDRPSLKADLYFTT